MRGMNERLAALEHGAQELPRRAIAEDRGDGLRVFVLGRWPGEETEEMDEPTFRRRYPDTTITRLYELESAVEGNQ